MAAASDGEEESFDPKANRSERRAAFLKGLGTAVRGRRMERGLTLRSLAQLAQVSERFLVQLELGEGNISVARLQDVAEALDTSAAELLTKAVDVRWPPRRMVSLLGLRGAGKSTVGSAVARELGVPFIELDALVVQRAGMSLSAVFELHGEAYFRRLEREALRDLLESSPVAIVATGGSIVTDKETYGMLLSSTCTIWLRASAHDHWDRVIAQGDVRPMRQRTNAMNELKALLRSRKALYERAAHKVDTSRVPVDQAVRLVLSAIRADRRTNDVPMGVASSKKVKSR